MPNNCIECDGAVEPGAAWAIMGLGYTVIVSVDAPVCHKCVVRALAMAAEETTESGANLK